VSETCPNKCPTKCLDYIVTGVYEDPTADERGNFKSEDMHHRCVWGVADTRKHDFWECPANEGIDDPIIKQTSYLSKHAIKGWDEWTCLYARAIIPSEWLKKMDDIDYLDAKVCETPGFREVLERTGQGYSDGSGGPDGVPANVPQASFGAVASGEWSDCHFRIGDCEGIGGQVPGKQSVPRVELWGAIQSVIHAPSHITLRVGIDAVYVTNRAVRRNKLAPGPNGDLWVFFFDLVDNRIGTVEIHKVNFHLEDVGVKVLIDGWVTAEDLVGNTLADWGAEQVSEMIQPDLAMAKIAESIDAPGFSVRRGWQSYSRTSGKVAKAQLCIASRMLQNIDHVSKLTSTQTLCLILSGMGAH
jgi:hypothetical protein